jgi:type VI protein secretion system component Hcp
MTKSSKRNLVLAVTALFLLLASGHAFAGGKGGGGGGKQAGSDRPKESISLNYGKVEQTYTQQSKSKASPSLYNKTSTGKHFSKTTIVH